MVEKSVSDNKLNRICKRIERLEKERDRLENKIKNVDTLLKGLYTTKQDLEWEIKNCQDNGKMIRKSRYEKDQNGIYINDLTMGVIHKKIFDKIFPCLYDITKINYSRYGPIVEMVYIKNETESQDKDNDIHSVKFDEKLFKRYFKDKKNCELKLVESAIKPETPCLGLINKDVEFVLVLAPRIKQDVFM